MTHCAQTSGRGTQALPQRPRRARADPVYGAGIVDWDRLRERATPNLLDVALADIYLQPSAQPGITMPIEVTVQNQWHQVVQ